MTEILTEIVNVAREVVDNAKDCEKYLDQDDVNHMLINKLRDTLKRLDTCPEYVVVPKRESEALAAARVGRAVMGWYWTAYTDLTKKGLSNLREIGYRICLDDIGRIIAQAKGAQP